MIQHKLSSQALQILTPHYLCPVCRIPLSQITPSPYRHSKLDLFLQHDLREFCPIYFQFHYKAETTGPDWLDRASEYISFSIRASNSDRVYKVCIDFRVNRTHVGVLGEPNHTVKIDHIVCLDWNLPALKEKINLLYCLY